jgi:hypothetical protein
MIKKGLATILGHFNSGLVNRKVFAGMGLKEQ